MFLNGTVLVGFFGLFVLFFKIYFVYYCTSIAAVVFVSLLSTLLSPFTFSHVFNVIVVISGCGRSQNGSSRNIITVAIDRLRRIFERDGAQLNNKYNNRNRNDRKSRCGSSRSKVVI